MSTVTQTVRAALDDDARQEAIAALITPTGKRFVVRPHAEVGLYYLRYHEGSSNGGDMPKGFQHAAWTAVDKAITAGQELVRNLWAIHDENVRKDKGRQIAERKKKLQAQEEENARVEAELKAKLKKELLDEIEKEEKSKTKGS